MPRWFFVVVLSFGLVGLGSVVATMPDPLGTALSKLGEGGLWTWLALSIAIAAFLAFRPLKTGDRPPRE